MKLCHLKLPKSYRPPNRKKMVPGMGPPIEFLVKGGLRGHQNNVGHCHLSKQM